MRTVIGVDAGGTSTKAVLIDETGRRRGSGRSGPGNATSAGEELAERHLVEAALSAWSARDDDALSLPVAVSITAAGFTGEKLQARVAAGLAAGGIATELEVVGDILGAWCSAATEPDGAVLIVGTGAIAARIQDHEIVRIVDGLGWLVGDEGSGFWVGQAVMRAVFADLDGVGEATSLTRALLGTLGELPPGRGLPGRNVELINLLEWVYTHRPVELAQFAPLAFAAAGDPVADKIIASAAGHVLRRAELVMDEDSSAPLVLTGGLLDDASPLAQALRDRWPGRCRRAADGTAGAAMLALRQAGLAAGPEQLRLAQS